MHEDTDFSDVVWPSVPDSGHKATQFRRRYERLKLLMDEKKNFADEHFFLRKELECREVEARTSLTRWSIRMFRLTSDFGWSMKRPIGWMVAIWAIGALLIGAAELWDYRHGAWPDCSQWTGAGPCPQPEYLNLGQVMGLSFSNLFAFLGLGIHIMRAEITSLTGVSEVIAGAQMFLGPIFLFLLALGLRNRFRIK